MKKYLFVHGRDPELSLLELISYFKKKGIQFKLETYDKIISIFSLIELDFKAVMNDLGGTVKIAEIISDTKNIEEVEYNLNNNLKYEDNEKIKFAISSYGTDLLPFVEGYIKNRFKRECIRGIYKKPQRKFTRKLMPSKLVGILGVGFELVLYKEYIAKTVAVFNPNDYKKRDLGRPKKDYMRAISIRLAKIMINLSQAREGGLLLDPFCGYGTVLQEALLMGVNVIGVDIEKESIKASEENLEWLKKNYEFNKDFRLINGDSRGLSKLLKSEVDAVVTEPYLGPYIKKLPTVEEAKTFSNKLNELYYGVIKEIGLILKKDGIVVIIVPVFKTLQRKNISTSFEDILNKTGFKVYTPFEGISVPILYSTEESKIVREIYILVKAN